MSKIKAAIVSLIMRGLIPIVLLVSGIFLLSLHIPGWSIIFGLPIVVFGTVFLIYTYDDLVSKKVVEAEKDLETCPICKEIHAIPKGTNSKDFICEKCREQIIK